MFKRLTSIVSEVCMVPEDSIKLESDFETDLGADSLDYIEIVMAVEEEFGITIADGAEFKTVGSLLEHIKNVL